MRLIKPKTYQYYKKASFTCSNGIRLYRTIEGDTKDRVWFLAEDPSEPVGACWYMSVMGKSDVTVPNGACSPMTRAEAKELKPEYAHLI